MKKICFYNLLVALLFFLTTNSLFAQTSTDNFKLAKLHIEDMLNGKDTLSYEKAIYEIENAYNGNTTTYSNFQQTITFYTELIKQLVEHQNVQPNYKPENFYQKVRQLSTQYENDFKRAKTNFGIFTFMTDTTFYRLDSNIHLYNLPFNYSSSDPMGTLDWKNTQITNLLETGKGNCFALSSLYKIFADRLQSDASLCTAPNHIYIRHLDEKGTRYNIDVASRTFPVTGTLQTLTYSTKEAIQNNIALRKLNEQQSVALCLVYLAKGYEMAFKTKDDFMMQCAEIALKYDSLNLNAMLLKAELLENNVLLKKKTIVQLQTDSTFKQYEKLIAKLYALGYREMPTDMKNILVNDWTKDTTQLYLINHLVKQEQETRKWTLSSGVFDEEHKYKPIEQYSQTLFDCKTKKITGFSKEKPLYNNYNFDPVVFAMNVDPLVRKLPSESPYSAFGNNPILNIDIGGKFRFNSQTLALMKDKYPLAYKYLYENVVNNIEGNITELAESRIIINAMISNTPHANLDKATNNNEIGEFTDTKYKLTSDIIKAAFKNGGGQVIEIVDKMKGMEAGNMLGGVNEDNDGTDYSTPIQLNTKLFENLNNATNDQERLEALTTLTSIIIQEYMEDFANDEHGYNYGRDKETLQNKFFNSFGAQSAGKQIYKNITSSYPDLFTYPSSAREAIEIDNSFIGPRLENDSPIPKLPK